MVDQNNLPAQFHAVKDDDEEFIWVGEPKFFPFICTGIPFLIFGLLWGTLDFAFIKMALHTAKKGPPLGFIIPFFILHLAPFWLSVLNIVRLLLVHKNTFYAITNKRVMIRSGF